MYDISNTIDIVSVIPFFIELGIGVIMAQNEELELLKLCRMLRIFRIAKISRHNENLRILVRTMMSSTGELMFMCTLIGLSIVVFSSACYLVENGQKDTKFTSIPRIGVLNFF